MSRQEILIVTEDNEFVVRLIKFIEQQPVQNPPKTSITFLEEGSNDLLEGVLRGVDLIRSKRAEKLEIARKNLRITRVKEGEEETC